MREYLVFTLTAALGAMGDLAGHERRGTLGWPGRSAILGLLGAALGMRRDADFTRLDCLSVAVAIFDEGEPLRDYQTVETVPNAAAKRPQSRSEALVQARGHTNTMVTLRDYRTGPLYGVAVWGGELSALEAALRSPAFVLYLGRKSCPLSAPTSPRIVDANGPAEALRALSLPPWRRGEVALRMMSDDGAGDWVETRHDIPVDRKLRHFARRAVHHSAVRIAPGAGA